MGLVESGGTSPDPPSLSKWVTLELWSNSPSPGVKGCKLASPCLSVLSCEMALSTPCFRAAVKIECIRGAARCSAAAPETEGDKEGCVMQHDGSGISLLSPFYSERRRGRDTEEWKTSGTVWTRAQGGRDAWPYTMVRWLREQTDLPKASQWTGSSPQGLTTARTCTLAALSPSRPCWHLLGWRRHGEVQRPR